MAGDFFGYDLTFPGMKPIFLPFQTNGSNMVRSSFASSMLHGFSRREIVTANVDFCYPSGMLNLLATAFLKSTCDRMFIVDGDIGFSRNEVDMLLEHEEEPLVFGYYRKKKSDFEFALESFDGGMPKQYGKFWRVKSAARGFSVWRRDVFDQLRDDCAPYYCPLMKCETFEYFKCRTGGHSEDFDFCDRWRALGNHVLVDPRVAVTHFGDFAFSIPRATDPEPSVKDECRHGTPFRYD